MTQKYITKNIANVLSTRFPWMLVTAITLPLMNLTASTVNPIWHEAENFSDTSVNAERALSKKPPASGGKSVAGSVFTKADSNISYDLSLPHSVPNAKIIIRYARLHFREEMLPAQLRIVVNNDDNVIQKEVTCGDTNGWGTNSSTEWDFAEVALNSDLKSGPLKMQISAVNDNSDVNIDGFFIATEDFQITSDEVRNLQRIHISSTGYTGLQIAGDTVFPGAFEGFELVARGFGKLNQKVSAVLINADKTESSILQTSSFAKNPDTIRVDVSAFDSFSDGDYHLKINLDENGESLRYPITIMRKLVVHAKQKASEFRDEAERRNKSSDATDKILVPDLIHAADYIENTIFLLEARQRGEATTSERAAALAYFEKSQTKTAKGFAQDIKNIIEQIRESLQAAANGADNPYAGRMGEFRRAFYSNATQALEPYRIFLPDAYAELDSIPLILMLHGGGGDENYFPEIENGVVKQVLNKRPYVMLSPKSTSWYRGPGLKDLKQLIDETIANYPKVDPSRIYCTGVSAGGGGTYRMAVSYPELFRAIATVSSGPSVTDETEKLKSVPILIIHGETDVVSPVERSRNAAAELKKRNLPHKLITFPDYGHEYHGEEYLNITLDFFESHL